MGSDLGVDVDTRLIAATNRDLQEMVIQGDFREDLFYRLYVVVITLPPLRERGDDVLLLLNHYLAQFCEENGKSIRGFTPEAYTLLAGYGWPGNIRELRNLVERMVVLARGEWLDVMDLPPQVRQQGGEPGGALKPGEGMTVEQMEQEMILQALERTGGNRTLAAEQLGMSRRTLHRKLNKLGLTRQVVDVRVEEDEQNG